MKLKEFFTQKGEQGKFKDDEYQKFIETLPDFEVPDEVTSKIEENFMTVERAKADKKVMGAARAEAYSIMDERIEGILPLIEKIDKTLVIEIAGEKDTLKKISKLGPALEKISTKASGASDTEKEKEYQKNIKEATDRYNTLQAEHEKNTSKLKSDFEEEKKSLNLEYVLRDKINKIEFADEHKPLRGAIQKLIISDLKDNNHLSLDESGEIVVSVLENGVPKPKFEGNTQVVFSKVLEEKARPYVKRNNVDTKEKPDPTKQQRQQTPSEGKKTLRQIQLESAAQQGV